MDKFNLHRLKTCTTRAIRPEESGDEYYFLSNEEYTEKLNNNQFAEHATVYTNSYGLEKSEIENHRDRNCIIITDVQGKNNLVSLYPNIVTVFIAPPSEAVILARLRSRNTSDSDVNNRIQEFNSEIDQMHTFDYIVPYGDLNDMNTHMESVIRRVLSL